MFALCSIFKMRNALVGFYVLTLVWALLSVLLQTMPSSWNVKPIDGTIDLVRPSVLCLRVRYLF